MIEKDNRSQILSIKSDNKKIVIIFTVWMQMEGKEEKEEVEMKFTGKHKAHVDFSNAIKALRKHFTLILELTSLKVSRVEVNGITYEGMDEDVTAAVKISASIRNGNGKSWEATTPATLLGDTEKYNLAEELDKRCNTIVKEAWRYMEGKNGDPQTKIDFGEDGNFTVTRSN